MRYISLLFIVALMAWSWSVANRNPVLTEDVHVGIQTDLQRVITEYLSENMPSATDVRFEKFWTETIQADRVKATFAYSFDDSADENSTRVGVEGYAMLNRVVSPQSDSEYDVWSLDELYVLNNKVTFKDGITVGPGSDTESDDTEE